MSATDSAGDPACRFNRARGDDDALFESQPDRIYLNTAGAAPRLRAVTQAAQQALSDSAAPWNAPPTAWRDHSEALRTLAAGLFETEADALAFVPTVSYGMAVAAHNLRLHRGQNVVTLAREYPSNRAVWQVRAQAAGARLRSAQPEPGQSWTGAVLRQLDADTAVVSIPHCHWADGSLLDLHAIADAARRHGASLVIDASQSLGALPLDLSAVNADFVIAPGHKWLLGPYGLGWLWVAPRWRSVGEPLEHSILSREALGDYTALGDALPPHRAGARRFDFSAYPHPLSVPMALAALRQLHDWGGVAALGARLGALTGHLRHTLAARGLAAFLKGAHAPHLCAFTPPPASLARVQRALDQAGIVVAVRGQGIRIAPHLHVGTAQLDRLAEVLGSAL